MKILIIWTLISCSTMIFGQSFQDYVILKPQNGSTKPDTVFGKIELPKNGIILNAKIITGNGTEKYKIKKTIGFKAGDVYFASLKYNKGYVFAPRLIDGAIDLYFYYSGTGGYTFVYNSGNIQAGLITGVIAGAMQAVAVSMTSYFYIYDPKTKEYYRIPHSSSKFKEQIGEVFKDNTEIYNKIISGDYKPKDIPKIVEIYNKQIN